MQQCKSMHVSPLTAQCHSNGQGAAESFSTVLDANILAAIYQLDLTTKPQVQDQDSILRDLHLGHLFFTAAAGA